MCQEPPLLSIPYKNLVKNRYQYFQFLERKQVQRIQTCEVQYNWYWGHWGGWSDLESPHCTTVQYVKLIQTLEEAEDSLRKDGFSGSWSRAGNSCQLGLARDEVMGPKQPFSFGVYYVHIIYLANIFLLSVVSVQCPGYKHRTWARCLPI